MSIDPGDSDVTNGMHQGKSDTSTRIGRKGSSEDEKLTSDQSRSLSCSPVRSFAEFDRSGRRSTPKDLILLLHGPNWIVPYLGKVLLNRRDQQIAVHRSFRIREDGRDELSFGTLPMYADGNTVVRKRRSAVYEEQERKAKLTKRCTHADIESPDACRNPWHSHDR